MSQKVKRFSVSLALPTLNEEQVKEALSDLQEELAERPHYELPRVHWDPEKNQVIVTLLTEADSTEDAASLVAEELFEILPAILSDPSGMRVEVLNAYPVDADS